MSAYLGSFPTLAALTACPPASTAINDTANTGDFGPVFNNGISYSSIATLPPGVIPAGSVMGAVSPGVVSTNCPTFVPGNGYNYNALPRDSFILVTLNADASSPAQQLVNLPTSNIPAGKTYMVKAATGATRTVIIQNTVDGITNYALQGTGEGAGGLAGNGVILVWDGVSSYWVVGTY